jgi:hypothetical protein
MTGAEIPILAAILGGTSKTFGDAGLKGAEALIVHFRKEGPIANRILASWKESGHHCIAIEFLNTTLHGGYVEDVNVTKPNKNLAFMLGKPDREKANNMGLSESTKDKGDASLGIKWAKPEELLPLYVPPAGTASMLLQLRDDAAKTLSNSSAASLSYEFSIVGGDPQKKSKEFQVRLRNKGPLYLK